MDFDSKIKQLKAGVLEGMGTIPIYLDILRQVKLMDRKGNVYNPSEECYIPKEVAKV